MFSCDSAVRGDAPRHDLTDLTALNILTRMQTEIGTRDSRGSPRTEGTDIPETTYYEMCCLEPHLFWELIREKEKSFAETGVLGRRVPSP